MFVAITFIRPLLPYAPTPRNRTLISRNPGLPLLDWFCLSLQTRDIRVITQQSRTQRTQDHRYQGSQAEVKWAAQTQGTKIQEFRLNVRTHSCCYFAQQCI